MRRSTSQDFEASEDVGSSPVSADTIGESSPRGSQRDLGRGLLAVLTVESVLPISASSAARAVDGEAGFSFDELAAGFDETHHVSAGYDTDVLIRWGDPVVMGAPVYDPPESKRVSSATTTTSSSTY
jgi:secreted PhoX family phosphatase